MDKATLKAFKRELKDLLIKYGVSLEVDLDGDTHCLTTNFIVYSNKNTNDFNILSHYNTTLSPSDL